MSESQRGAEGNPSDVVRGAAQWVDEQAESAGTFLRLMQLQHEQPDRYFAAVDATRHETQRAVLTALVSNSGTTDYNDIERYTTVSRRSIRKHVSTLEEQNLVERIDSQYYAITFSDETAQVLVQHALTLYYVKR